MNRRAIHAVLIWLLGLALPLLAPGQAGAADYKVRGIEEYKKGDLDAALADLTRAIEGNPKDAEACLNRGFVRQAKGDLDGASADYNHAIELDPKDARPYNNRGFIKHAKGDWEGALADFNTAIKLAPKLPQAHLNRGNLKQARGDLDGALADYNQAIKLDPKDAPAYCNRGLVKRARDDWEGALADYTRCLELDPNYAPACYSRGVARMAKGETEGALADFRRDVELDPAHQDYARIYIWLIRARKRETTAANEELSTFLNARANGSSGDWPSKVMQFLLNKINESDLSAASDSPDRQKQSAQQCEFWYYAGMKQLLTGNSQTAAEDFQKCLATGRKNFSEYAFAQAELKAMGR
jgi:lipoprotein NlpI